MTEKSKLLNAKRKRDPLGKSLSDILLQTKVRKYPVSSKPEQTIISVNQSKELELSEKVLDSEKLSNAKAIGTILKRRREQKKLTLDAVSNNLCLKTSFLSSIELGAWENLPHKVYVRGYIRKYADMLDVENEVTPYLTEDDKIQQNAVKSRNEADQKPDKKLRPDYRILLLLLPKKTPSAMLLYTVVIALTLAFLFFDGKRRFSAEMSRLENAVQVSKSIGENDLRKNLPEMTDSKKLMITCHERTWISVIIDGMEKKEFTLKPQEVVILNAKERFDLLIGNAGGIRLLLDGKDTSFTGENGQVKRVTLS